MNIEKLDGWSVSIEANGENILTISNQHLSGITNINDYKELVIHCANHLCAFIGAEDAKALQSSEPVAKYKASVGGFSPPKWVTHQEKHSGNLGEGYLPLFTLPPASVPLEKYNKLFGAIKNCLKWANGRQAEWGTRAENAFEFLEKAIAEAEGKEG